jgi:hypothetical protein
VVGWVCFLYRQNRTVPENSARCAIQVFHRCWDLARQTDTNVDGYHPLPGG